MIDHGRWIDTLPIIKNKDSDYKKYSTDPNKWTDSIPKKNTKNGVKKFSLTLTLALFVIGLILVSTIKNKTRNLQKEINDLRASISDIKTDLHKATLDYEVITSPENISQLAEKYLETELVYYKKSQIKELHEKAENPTLLDVTKDSKLKIKIKLKVAKKIEEKKIELKNLYSSPKETVTMVKAQKWAAVQVIKVFLGIPVIPGR